MKKIFALVALVAVAPVFAAQNTFTFQVNSSGSEVYICGFQLDIGPAKRKQFAATRYWPKYSGSSVSWDEETVDTWTGEVDKTESLNKVFVKNSSFSRHYEHQLIGSTDKYKRISKLTFNLSDEYFGAHYNVLVCYNVPLFMDLSKVDFDVTMHTQFENMTAEGRDYLEKAKIKTGLSVNADITDGTHFLGIGSFDMINADVANGNVAFQSLAHYPVNPQGTNEAVIRANYFYYESASGPRPHVAHGGHFTLDTTFTPVEKSTATK